MHSQAIVRDDYSILGVWTPVNEGMKNLTLPWFFSLAVEVLGGSHKRELFLSKSCKEAEGCEPSTQADLET